VWATDEHRSGLTPLLRRVWAPKGTRPVMTIQPRSRWRSRGGHVHPASGRTHWHPSSSSHVERFTRALSAFAEQVGAGPDQEVVLVRDRAGGHMSPRLAIPAHRHLAPLPAYTPELQPAERRWSFANTPLVNARPTDLDELDTLQRDRCAALQTDPALVATIQSATH